MATFFDDILADIETQITSNVSRVASSTVISLFAEPIERIGTEMCIIQPSFRTTDHIEESFFEDFRVNIIIWSRLLLDQNTEAKQALTHSTFGLLSLDDEIVKYLLMQHFSSKVAEGLRLIRREPVNYREDEPFWYGIRQEWEGKICNTVTGVTS